MSWRTHSPDLNRNRLTGKNPKRVKAAKEAWQRRKEKQAMTITAQQIAERLAELMLEECRLSVTHNIHKAVPALLDAGLREAVEALETAEEALCRATFSAAVDAGEDCDYAISKIRAALAKLKGEKA